MYVRKGEQVFADFLQAELFKMNEVGKRVRTPGSENYICTVYSRLGKSERQAGQVRTG